MRVVRILIVAATSVLVAVPAVAAVPFPSLEAAQSAAMRVAPAARLAKAGLLQGQAGRAAAGLSRWHNPQLEIRGDRGNKKVTEDVYLQVNLMWPLEVSGQSQARQTESDNLHQQLRTEQVAAQASARGEVSAAWGAVVVGAERLRLLQRLVETAAAEAEALRKRAELGDVRRPDQLLAEVERSRNQAILQSEQARLQGQLAELESLTGLNLGDTDLPAMAIEPELPAAPIDVPPMAATALAEANLLRSSEQRLREEAKPPLTLMVTTARGDFGEYRLGAGVLWTLPSTRRNQAERARTLATARAAEVRADVVRTQVAVQVRNLLREWKQLHEARTALVAQSLPGAHAAIRAAEATVLAGKGERTTVWLARRTALELELRALELKERQWAIAGLLTGWLTPPSDPTTSPEDTDPYGPEEK